MSLGCAFLCHSHCELVFVQQKYAESSPGQKDNFSLNRGDGQKTWE